MRWHRKDTYKCKLKRHVNEFRYGGKSVMGNDDADGLTTLKRPRMLPTFRASAQSIMAEINFNERRRTKKKKRHIPNWLKCVVHGMTSVPGIHGFMYPWRCPWCCLFCQLLEVRQLQKGNHKLHGHKQCSLKLANHVENV